MSKQILKSIFVFALFLIFTTKAQAYTLPSGIPDPGFGLDETKPARPQNWTVEIPGHYYVENISGCSNTRVYGYPGYSRCAIPNPIPAGSRVEVHGLYHILTSGLILIKGEGTAENPVWVVGESADVRPTFDDITSLVGSYVYLEDIYFHFTNSGDAISIGSTAKRGFGGNHFMIRNCTMEGDLINKTGGVGIKGYFSVLPEEPTENVIIVGNESFNHGLINAPEDLDAHTIAVNKRARDIWILDNHLHDIGGSGIAIGQEGPAWKYDDIERVYVGRNNIYRTTQAASAVKGSNNVVFSENIVHDQYTRWAGGVIGSTVSSPSKCFGWKGQPQNFWIINNTCYNNSYGVHGGSTETGDWHIYVIGNTFRNIYAQKPAEYDGANAWSEAAISLVGGNHVYAINNSIYNSASGIMTPGSGSYDKYYYIENNIVSKMTELSSSHINIENSANQTIIKNNILYQPNGVEMIRWRSSGEYSLAEFQAAEGKCQGCVNTDPQFVNASNGDFSINANSPARDNGLTPSSLAMNVYALYESAFGKNIEVDMKRIIRPQGASWDMGAYEYIEQVTQSDTQAPSTPNGVSVE